MTTGGLYEGLSLWHELTTLTLSRTKKLAFGSSHESHGFTHHNLCFAPFPLSSPITPSLITTGINKGEDTDSAMEKFIKKFGTGAGNSGGKDGSTGLLTAMS